MSAYFFSQTHELSLDEAVERVTAELREEGFGLLTEIDAQATINKKLGIEIAPYRILGFCNPHFAYQALQLDRHIGTLLPCSVVVQEHGPGRTEVSALNPARAMDIVENEALQELAGDVTRCLRRGLNRVSNQVVVYT